jgi:hypothetical protein
VDEPGRVRRRQPAPRLQEHGQHLAPGPLPRATPARQRLSLDELHGDEHLAAERAHVVHRDHVRVRRPRQCLRLAQESRLLSGAALSRINFSATFRSSSGSYTAYTSALPPRPMSDSTV